MTITKKKPQSSLTIKDLAKRVKMPPSLIRARLRRHMPRHAKGKTWNIPVKQVPKVIKLLK